MTATEQDGIAVVVQPEIAWNPNRHLDTIEREINGAPGPAAITLDCDGIALFPALPLWVFEEGFDIKKVIRIIRNTSSKLLRFDIGGFVEGIQRFDVIPRDELVAPTLEEVAMISGMYQRTTSGMSQPIEIRNRVCSKAFWIYVDAMDAFFSTE